MDKMLVVQWHALHIPRDSAIALELATCPLPLATRSNQAPLLKQAQILKVCHRGLAVNLFTYLTLVKKALGTTFHP